jgi:hypothetical protein
VGSCEYGVEPLGSGATQFNRLKCQSDVKPLPDTVDTLVIFTAVSHIPGH